ncbi:MAG TPA: serine hydrolase domain-containing protein [Solirubrobacterales bacterium]|jgi:CubicO group peptidase (beta-lactamase class C family)|nr:serine hydrolase domain-containing protein [Solirubrobacterales bacterium]
MGAPALQGECDARFAPLADALRENFASRGELGAAVAVVLDGRPVVDLWGGWADEARTRPWARETIVDGFSVGKAMAALCALRLAEHGALDLDAPVAERWPEFGAAGKEAITARMILAHRAGLPAIRRLLPLEAIFDWERIATALAAEQPWWEPGSAHGYHVNTFGFLIGEVVRRAAGVGIAEYLRREITGPLDADFGFGLGPEEQARCAEFSFGGGTSEPTEEDRERALGHAGTRLLLERAYWNPPGISGTEGTVNTPAWRAAVIPSANGHGTARGVARIYAALLGPVAADPGAAAGSTAPTGSPPATRGPLLEPATLAEAIAEASSGADLVLGRPSRFGLGFQLTEPERPLGPNPRAFGHFGAGGSLGFADPDAGLAFAYLMNRGGPRWRSPRNRALLEALYASV